METRFVKAYIDELTFGNLTSEDRELLKKYGYTEDEQGEVAVSFKFGDGIAFVPNGCGLVLHYPTLVEVAQSEKMQQEIAAYTNRSDIIPFDIALKYGRLGEYKYVLNYDEWVQQGENCNKDICSLYRKGEDNNLNHYLDCFEQEYNALYKNGYFPIGEGEYEDGHTLRDGLTDKEIYQLRAEYGILWTEWIGNHVYDNRGYLVEYVEKELTYKERVKLMADRIAAFGGTMVIWNDKEFHFAFESGWRYRTAHGEMWVKEVKSNDIIVTDGEKNWEIPTWLLDEKFMYQLYMTFVKVCERNLTEIAYKKVMLAIGEE